MQEKIQNSVDELLSTETDLVETPPIKPPIVSSPKDVGEDYEYARSNLKELIDNGMNLFRDAIDVARDSESPRAFEVAGNIMKSLVDSNKDLLDLQKTMKTLDEKSTSDAQTVTNNNLMLSTKDLLDLIRSEKKN